MYMVTAREMDEALKECRATKIVGGQEVPDRTMNPEHMPLISFPWLFPSELGKIATGAAIVRQLGPVQIPQELPHQHRKNTGAAFQIGNSEVETGDGTTHYGELLKLKFNAGPPVLLANKESQSTTPETAASEVPTVSSSDISSPPIVNSYEWKRCAKQAATETRISEEESGPTQTSSFILDKKSSDIRSEKESEQEGKQEETALDSNEGNKKRSILDRLMRLI